MDLERIREYDSQIFVIITENFHEFSPILKQNNLPMVGRALSMIATKSSLIKNSIYDISENNELYSVNILYRALIEHHLKFMYIFTRHLKEKNDNVGIEYYRYCDFIETLKVERSFIKEWDSQREIDEDKLYNLLVQFYPDVKQLDKREIISKVKQFSYDKIIKHLKLNYNNSSNKEMGFIDKLLGNYSELSSYVHCGPFADKIILPTHNDELREKEVLNICEMSFMVANSLFQFVYLLLYQTNKDYGKSYNAIKKIIDGFQSCHLEY